MLQRLQKIIAQAGIASRRNAEVFIEKGLVTVNGKQASIGQSADPDKDVIEINGERIQSEKFVYVLLNKPKNVVTTLADERDRTTVRELIDVPERVFPVGRLDRNATGLVLLTNDGTLANRMMHPRYETLKTYVATLSSPVSEDLLARLRKGVVVDSGKVQVRDVEQKGTHKVAISIHEGRKHIIKKLFVKLGTHVDALERTKLGMLQLGKLQHGEWRMLLPQEVLQLKKELKL
jgi:23S rRNA pseudouridine2605 synthase